MTRQTYPVARYHFVFEVITPVRLPEYAGSMLRGAFGQALKRTACMTREKDCKTCPLYRSCPYAAIFESPAPDTHILQKFSQVPAPYVIEPPEWGARIYAAGERLRFSMVLVGRALEQLALVTYAWQRAFSRGVGHGTARLTEVLYEKNEDGAGTESIFDPALRELKAHENRLHGDVPAGGQGKLVFLTPLRLQNNGHALPPKELTARPLLMSLVRRIALLSEFHMGQILQADFSRLAHLAGQIQYDHQLTWQDWTRYSSRQQKTMQLGGVTGTWVLKDIPAELMPYLYLGQWVHVGKNATFGLGRYLFSSS